MPRPSIAIQALLCALVLLSCAHRHEDALTRVQRSGVLRWGGDIQGGEPYVYDDPEHPGQLIGFEVDLAAAIARKLGVRAEFVQQDWSNLVPSLERGSFDIALNGIEVTEARLDRALFSRPYYVFAARLMVRHADRAARSLDDMGGRRIGTLANSFSYDLLQASRAETVSYEGCEEPYADLINGRVDGVLLDDIISDRYGAPHPELHVAADVREGYYAVAAAKTDPALARAIDEAVAELTQTGELRQILQRANLWNERQSHLAQFSGYAHTAHAARAFSWSHFKLFAQGAAVSLAISTVAMMLAVLLGFSFAILRLYGPRFAAILTSAYVEIFRGTPVLLQLYVIYFGLMPELRHALGFQAGIVYDAVVAATLGLGLNYAAYEAEVYRSGIQAIPPGQMEAALVLGMRKWLAIRRIIVPQAFRMSLPGVTNDFIALLKDSSLVSVITVVELTKRMTITAVDLRSWMVPGLMCALFYFAMSYPLSVFSRNLERKLAGEDSP